MFKMGVIKLSKKKFYAVKKGKKIGIYNTWDECKKQVMDFLELSIKVLQL